MVNISKRMISSDLTMSTDANDGSWSLATKKRSTGTETANGDGPELHPNC